MTDEDVLRQRLSFQKVSHISHVSCIIFQSEAFPVILRRNPFDPVNVEWFPLKFCEHKKLSGYYLFVDESHAGSSDQLCL